MGTDALPCPNEAQTLCGCGLNTHPVNRNSETFCGAFPNGIDVRPQLGLLKTHRSVNINHTPAIRANLGHGLPKKNFAIDPVVYRVSVGKMRANVSHGPRPKERITNHMKEDVGITVSNSTHFRGNANSPEPKLFSFRQLVDIVTVSDAEVKNTHVGGQ